MSVITYSLIKDGDLYVGPHFRVREFRCKDGSDTILIDTELVETLELIRAVFNKAVTITSAYRTPEYNAKVGGAKQSRHLYGKAADIAISGVSEAEVCGAAETALASMGRGGGVGCYPGRFSHVDTRGDRARWQQDYSGGPQYNVTGFGGDIPPRRVLRKGDVGDDVRVVQGKLGIAADGVFGGNTENAVKTFQLGNGLTPDGAVGSKTYAKLDIIRRTLRMGDHGYDVAELQQQLGVLPDGAFGPDTKAALIVMQMEHKLTADGVAGPATYAVLDRLNAD